MYTGSETPASEPVPDLTMLLRGQISTHERKRIEVDEWAYGLEMATLSENVASKPFGDGRGQKSSLPHQRIRRT